MNYFYYTFLFYFILFLIGLGPALWYGKFLQIRNIYHLVVYSITIGILLSSFIFVILGSEGIEILGDIYPFIILSLIFVSAGLLTANYLRQGPNEYRSLLSESRIFLSNKSNIFVLLLLLSLLIFLLTMNSKVYVYRIDEFRYWLTDAKYIFNYKGFRFDRFLVPHANYSSFYTLQLAQVHRLFGRLVEQYTSIIPILYLIVGLALIHINSVVTGKGSKYLLIITLLSLFLIFYPDIFLAYADIAVSFYILLSIVIIIKKFPTNYYYAKIFLTTLSLLAISFVKLPELLYSPYSILLFICWLYYDRRDIIELLKSDLPIKLKSILALIFPSIVIITNYRYRSNVFPNTNTTDLLNQNPISSSISTYLNEGEFSQLFKYPFYVGEFFWDNYLGLMLFFLLIIFLVLYLFYKVYLKDGLRGILKDRQIIIYSAVIFLFPIMNLSFYALYNRRSQLERYLTAAILVGGLLLMHLYSKKYLENIRKYVIVMMLAIFIVLIPDYFSPRFDQLTNNMHDGSYRKNSSFSEVILITDDVKKRIGSEKVLLSRIQIHCGSKKDKCISNTPNNLRKYEYFLQDNIISKSYNVNVGDFEDLLNELDVKYILTTAGFEFVTAFDTKGDKNKYIHLYEYDKETNNFRYLKGYQDFDYY